MVQTGFLAFEQRQPAFAGGEEAFSSRRLQAKMFLIPFLRALNVAHAEGDVIEIDGVKGGGRVRRTRGGELGLLIGEGDGRAHSRGKDAGQMRDQLPPAHPAVLEVVN